MKWVRGVRGYAAVLVALSNGDATTACLAARLHTKRDTVRKCLRAFYRHGLIHVGGWCRALKGPPAAVWRIGAGSDAPALASSKAPTAPELTGTEMLAFVCFVQALMAAPSTSYQLHDESGLNRHTCRRLIAALRSLIHVAEWDRTHHVPVPAYAWGQGIDARRPKAESRKKTWRRYNSGRRLRYQQTRIQTALTQANDDAMERAA